MGRPRKYQTPEARKLARSIQARIRRAAKKDQTPEESTHHLVYVPDFSRLPSGTLERLGLVYDPRESEDESED